MSAPTLPTRHAEPDLDAATVVADALTFPRGVAFDSEGVAYVAESGLRPDGSTRVGRVWRLAEDGTRTLVCDRFRAPITGLVFAQGALWVSQGGAPGRISRLGTDGSVTHVLTDLPGGEHGVGEVTFGPDGKLYFGLGSLTNTGIAGPAGSAAALDVPGYDIVLNDVRVRTADGQVTGPFSPYGEVVHAHTHVLGARFWGRPLATAAVHRANPDGSDVELVCWGLRHPSGLRFLPDGRLLAIDHGADDRDSRPVGGIPDFLWDVREGAWYGWPDYFGGRPATDPAFRAADGSTPTFLLANHDQLPPPERPLSAFGATATAFDVDPASDGRVIAVGLVRDDAPRHGEAPRGEALRGGPRSAIALVRTADGAQRVLPAPSLGSVVDVRFHPVDGALWVVDYGVEGYRRGRVLRLESRLVEG